jgi:hypothetical protein
MTDRLVVLIVVFFIGLAAVGSMVGAVVIRAAGEDIPGELWQFGGVALGALGSLLASTRSTPPNPPAPPLPNVPPEV